MNKFFILFFIVCWQQTSLAQERQETYQKLAAFNQAFDLILQHYAEPVNPQQLIDAAIREMVSALDAHSSYFSASENLEQADKNDVGGIGIITTKENDVLEIVDVIEGTPAFKANLKVGDQILAVNDHQLNEFNLDTAGRYIRGPIGTRVVLVVKRLDQLPFHRPSRITMVRQKIPLKTSYSRILGNNIGYIAITTFTGSTSKAVYQEFQKQIAKINQLSGSRMQGLILDLRNNLGGWIEEAIYIADAVLEQGEIVSIESPNKNYIERYQAKPGDVLHGVPIIILVNHSTASSAEILTAALQENKRAIVLGTRTYGKATVWREFGLSSYGAIRLTTEFAYGPSGRSWQRNGIIPDITIEQGILHITPSAREDTEETYKNNLDNPLANDQDYSHHQLLYLPKADMQLREAILLMRGFYYLRDSTINKK
jgi:carboxyl-terminal processing protease